MAEACNAPQGATKDRLSELREQCVAITHECSQLLADADREGRVLSDEEIQRTAALNAEFEAISKEIAQREQVLANAARIQTQSAGRRTVSETATQVAEAAAQPQAAQQSPRIAFADPRRKYAAGTHGFKSLGEQALAARHAALFPGQMDERLQVFNVSTYQSEGVGADGGFAVPPDFRSEILRVVTGEDSLVGRCTQLTTGSNEISFPIDETTPWASSGIVTAYWDGEGGTGTASKMSGLKKHRIPVDKLTAMVYVTDELLQDAPALGSYLANAIREHIEHKVGEAIFRGVGVGQPKGILTALASSSLGPTLSVAKTASQVADTLTGDNIVKMWARLYARCRPSAVWYINQDIEPQLQFLMKQGKLDTGATDTGWGVPLYVQPGGLSNSQYGTLFGRPVVPTEHCDTLGDQGDVVLADLSKYYVVTKNSNGPQFDTSIHFAFDQNLTAFRVTWRLGGAPAWTAPITPNLSSNTLSCFVTLDARA